MTFGMAVVWRAGAWRGRETECNRGESGVCAAVARDPYCGVQK